MKRALLVGIDHYHSANNLSGCVNDAEALLPLLARNEDGSRNFDCKQLLAPSGLGDVARNHLIDQINALLAPGADFALLYFAGHGKVINGDLALVTTDGRGNTPGVRFGEVLEQIGTSKVNEIAVVLDCCFSGGAGTVPVLSEGASVLRNGLSMLAASRIDQPSAEQAGRGKFSTYLEGALDGGAADVLGVITVAGLYAYLSESFDSWGQQPVFKANVDRLHELRRCRPAVPLSTLHELPSWFRTADHELPLDPTYEPDAGPEYRHAEHERVFGQLQACRAAKLVEPVGHDHMYYAAMQGLACRLTPLGRHYWSIAKAGLI